MKDQSHDQYCYFLTYNLFIMIVVVYAILKKTRKLQNFYAMIYFPLSLLQAAISLKTTTFPLKPKYLQKRTSPKIFLC